MWKPIRKKAKYKGHVIFVEYEENGYYFAAIAPAKPLPDDFFEDMEYPYRGEYQGKIKASSPDLEFIE